MTTKKSLNLRGDDRERWTCLKMKRITAAGDPDLNDIELLREMMEDYEAKLESQDAEIEGEQQ